MLKLFNRQSKQTWKNLYWFSIEKYQNWNNKYNEIILDNW